MEGTQSKGRDSHSTFAAEVGLPVSQAQAGMWFETRLDPDSRHYNLLWEAELRGPADEASLRSTWGALVARHPSMRTRFGEESGEARARVLPAAEIPFEYQDLRDRGEDAWEAWSVSSGQGIGRVNRNLELGPLFEVRVARVGEREHRLLVMAHHMVADGFSWPILLREWVGLLGGAELPPLRVGPTEVARWQAEYLASEEGRRAEAYWRGSFPDAPVLPEIPGQRPRPAVLDRVGRVRTWRVPDRVVSGVRECARIQETSVFRTLLAAFAAVVHRWTGENEVVLGTTLVGRTLPGAEAVVGFLNNVAAVRLVVRGGETFASLVRAAHAEVRLAAAHQEFPFARLAAGWKGGRSTSRVGLTGISFTKLPPREFIQSGEWEAKERRVFLDRSPHELAVYAQEVGGGIELICEYNPILYTESVIDRLVSQYLQFLEEATRAPEAALARPSLVLERDRGRLPDPHATLDTPIYPRVTEALGDRWRERPETIAVRQGAKEWRYADLRDCSRAVAQGLIQRGVPADAVVAVSGPRSFGTIAGMLGVWRAGCVLLTLDPNLPLARRRVMLEQSRAEGMVVVPGGGGEDTAALIQGLSGFRVLDVSEDGAVLAGPVSTGADVGWADRPSEGDAAYLFFTSGTTGAPKAVKGSHRGLGHFLSWQRTTFGIGVEDRAAQLTGLSFDVVLRDMFTPLSAGATLCLPPPGEEHLPGGLLDWLARDRVTLLHTVPSLAQAWMEQASDAKAMESVRLTFFAGEPLTDSLVRRWRSLCPGARILNLYGPTETTLAKCWHEVAGEPDPGIQPVGRPQPQTQAWVLNEAQVLCGVGEPGEIVIRTPFRSLGYANSVDETERKFVPNPFRDDPGDRVYLTGDRGRYREDGVLEILGRMDFQVKVRGVRIELNEVTAALAAHPDVRSCVVVAREDEPGRKYLAGYVVARDGVEGVVGSVTEHLRRLLPAAYVPDAIVVLERLPLTPNGKVDRRALPVPVRGTRTVAVAEARTLTERQVLDWMEELLKCGRLGPEDNFFEVGGHSLLALQLMAGLRKRMGVEVPLKVLFEKPTASALAEAVDAARARQSSAVWKSLTSLNLGGEDRPALFIFPGGNGGDRELYVHSYLAQKWLGGRRSVYALRMKGWDGAEQPHRDIRTMAREYMEEIRMAQRRGPYQFLGDCTGGNIAFETACQMQAAGESVTFLMLTDCIRPRAFEYQRFRFREAWLRWLSHPWVQQLRRWKRGARPPSSDDASLRGAEDVPSAAPSVGAPGAEYWTQLGCHYRRVITSFRPGRFRGRLHLVVSRGRSDDSRILRWGECATEGAQVTELPDDHWLYLWHHGDRIAALLEETERG